MSGGARNNLITHVGFGKIPVCESWFISEAQRRGFSVHRSGWPDYLIMRSGSFYFVEVKSKNDKLSRAQIEMHAALSEIGIKVVVARGEFPCEIKTRSDETKELIEKRGKEYWGSSWEPNR